MINLYSVFSFQGTEQKSRSAVLHGISAEAPLRGPSPGLQLTRISHQGPGTSAPALSSLMRFINKSGSRLLFHTVSSIVPSAVQVLTVVFGMRTGVAPARIATRQICLSNLVLHDNLPETQPLLLFLRKEVIQPHLPIQLPCYDFTPVIGPAFDGSLFR